MNDNNKIFIPVIKTERLVLRQWCEDDLETFANLNADSRVMEWFPSTLNRFESDELATRIMSKIKEQGWGLWAVSVLKSASFIGFIGLHIPTFDAHFTPTVEVGWRLAYEYWGKGYATEGALAALKFGFKTLNLKEIVSFTTVENQRSRNVMKKLGMYHDPKDDFDHPNLPKDHPLKHHVLYRMNSSN